jgi:hypothetical protein
MLGGEVRPCEANAFSGGLIPHLASSPYLTLIASWMIQVSKYWVQRRMSLVLVLVK